MYVFIMGESGRSFVLTCVSVCALVRVLRASIMDLDNATASLYEGTTNRHTDAHPKTEDGGRRDGRKEREREA